MGGCAANLAGLSPAELPGLLAGAAHGHQRFKNLCHVGGFGAFELPGHIPTDILRRAARKLPDILE